MVCTDMVMKGVVMMFVSSLLLLSVLFSPLGAKELYVKATNDGNCPAWTCSAFSSVLNNTSQVITSNTTVFFLPGNYTVSDESAVVIYNVTGLQLIGLSAYNTTRKQPEKIIFHCGGTFGFIFIKVENLVISNLYFFHCGAHITNALQNYALTTQYHKYLTSNFSVLYLMDVQNVNVTLVSIHNSIGAGLLGLNVLGHSVSVSHALFSGNHPNYHVTFYDNYQEISFGEFTNHIIEDSTFVTTAKNGIGLGMKFVQSNYSVHIYMRNITAYARNEVSDYTLYYVYRSTHTSVCSQCGTEVTAENIHVVNGTLKAVNSICLQCNGKFQLHINNSWFVGSNINLHSSISSQLLQFHNIIHFENVTVVGAPTVAVEVTGRFKVVFDSVIFDSNVFVLYATEADSIGFHGVCIFNQNGRSPLSPVVLWKSTVYISGEVIFLGNRGGESGAILAYESEIFIWGSMILMDNEGYDGGTLALYGGSLTIIDLDTELLPHPYCRFVDNYAQHNGGAIALYDGTALVILGNAEVEFVQNRAGHYGGAIYIDTKSFWLPLWVKCFYDISNKTKLSFYNNSAVFAGDALYGGSVDTCALDTEPDNKAIDSLSVHPHIASIFPAVGSRTCTCNPQVVGLYQLFGLYQHWGFYNSIEGAATADTFNPFSELNNTDSNPSLVSSTPSRVCLCNQDVQMCEAVWYNKTAYPGETFTVPATAVGQRFGTVPSTIRAMPVVDPNTHHIDDHCKLGNLQYRQRVGRVCTNLSYTIYSPNLFVTLSLSIQEVEIRTFSWWGIYHTPVYIHVHLKECPLGFEFSNTTMSCVCDKTLQRHNVKCNIDTKMIHRISPLWISVAHNRSVIIHKHCPFDYCKTENINVSLQNPDIQCSFQRSGVLCGECQPNLSHTLGVSKCKVCSNLWLFLIPLFALGGIALVVILTVLNLTVSSGTINGLIFYANVVMANKAIFFPLNTSFLGTFIAWLNLDLGIEACFFNGLDAYILTWLQFVFPLYIWLIVILIIVLSHYSVTLSKLTGRNPVPVLATLFLLSYAKLLRIIITAFSFTFLKYPNGIKKVWLYDANIKYLAGKHIPLFVIALLQLCALSAPYTAILLAIQWLQQISNLKILRWVQRLKPLFDAYVGPYKDKHRYWTGLLLLLRVILFLLFSVNVLGNPEVNLLAIIITSFCIFMYLAFLGGIYKALPLNLIEYSCFLNLGVFASATLFVRSSGLNQAAVTYTSVSIAFATFVGVVAYHIIARMSSVQQRREVSEWIAAKLISFRANFSQRRNNGQQDSLNQANANPGVVNQPTVTWIELRESLLEYCDEN